MPLLVTFLVVGVFLIWVLVVCALGAALHDSLAREAGLVVERDRLTRELDATTPATEQADPGPVVDELHLDLLISTYGPDIPEQRIPTEDS